MNVNGGEGKSNIVYCGWKSYCFAQRCAAYNMGNPLYSKSSLTGISLM